MKNYAFKCIDGPPPKEKPHYGKGRCRVSDVLSSWSDDPEERMTDWAAKLGPYVADGWRQQRAKLAAAGTLCHEAVEMDLDQSVSRPFGMCSEEVFEMGQRAFSNFLRWKETVHILPNPVLEETILHPSLPYGGTCDFKGEIDFLDGKGPQKVMLDWKTSGAIQRKMKLQLAAYNMLHRAKYGVSDFAMWGILRLSRDRETYEIVLWDNLDEEEFIFTSLLNIYHMTNLRRPRVSVDKNKAFRRLG